jgi:FkbM family methyltransferase
MVCLETERTALTAVASSARQPTTKSWLQRTLLATYWVVSRTGLLSTSVGRAAFATAYDFYKSRWEAPGIAALKSFVRPGTIVIDVGANIGFFTRRFAEWVRPGGIVIALEPEARNFASLNAVLSRHGLVNVEPIEAVAAECSGSLRLQINSRHPADHRIAEEGTEVRAITLDGMLEERGWPEVSFIKIDVQGAEERVLEGALETIRRFRPALYVEVDDAALRQMGSSSEQVLTRLQDAGYTICQLEAGKGPQRLSALSAISLSKSGTYSDFLFIPKG